MKKIVITIIAAVLATSLFSSCDRMLEEVNYGNPTTADLMTNESNVALLVGQCYAEVKWLHDHWGYWGVVTLTADEGLCPTRMPELDWADGGYWRNLNTHNWTEMGGAFRNIWTTTIAGAVLCNKLLKTLDDYKDSMSEKVYAQYTGELEVMRSYYYYMLFDCFGRIPYLEEFVDKADEPLMEPSKVWSKLVNCLEKNAPNLPKVTDDASRALNYGRATQGLAYSLLARLYLNAPSFDCTPENIDPIIDVSQKNEDGTYGYLTITSNNDFYTNAVRCCDAIINSKSYSIEPDYFTNFKIDNSGSKENIFVIVENGEADIDERSGGDGMMLNKLRIALLTLNYNHQKSYNMLETPWNGFCARPAFMDRYAATDVRGAGNEGKGTKDTKQWGWFLGPIYDANGKLCQDKDDAKSDAIIVKDIFDADGNVSLTEATDLAGARSIKYEIDKGGKYKYSENDFVLFRYADVLWMKEEAILRGGSGSSSYDSQDFVKLRNRCFAYDDDPAAAFAAAYPTLASPLSAASLDAILDERGREFSWENMRRRDLLRFDKFNKSDYVEFITATDDYRKWFPIPFKVLEKSVRDENGKPVWTQNPGYSTSF